MKKSNNSKSKQYLATVLQDRQGIVQKYGHNKRQSQDEPQSYSRFPQSYIYSYQSHILPSFNRKHTYTNKSYKMKKNDQQNRILSRQMRIEKINNEDISILRQRLQNIHHYYKELIEQTRLKTNEKTQIILDLVDQLQYSHQSKLQNLKIILEQIEQQKKQNNFVDNKMIQINNNIQQLISQSNNLKQNNLLLIKQINQNKINHQHKIIQLTKLQSEILDHKNQLELFQINNIKHNKIHKEIIEIFNTSTSISDLS